MLKISYIGQHNETNGFINELLESKYSASVDFLKPHVVLEEPSLLSNTSYDLIIYDLNSSAGTGKATHNISLISRHVKECTPILVLQPYDNEKLIRPLLEAGAMGALSPAPSEQEFSKALDHVLNGNTYPSFLE